MTNKTIIDQLTALTVPEILKAALTAIRMKALQDAADLTLQTATIEQLNEIIADESPTTPLWVLAKTELASRRPHLRTNVDGQQTTIFL